MLEIKNLKVERKNFSLKNINLNLNGGYILGIIGKNGAGKTTLFNSILDVIPIDDGSIKVFGKGHSLLNPKEKEEIGFYIGDSLYFSSFTIEDASNLIKKLYKNFDSDCFFKYCEKFKITFNKKIAYFSTGMKAKVWLAIALSHHAKLLILDEPTSGLDPVSREEILDILREYVSDENHSILISSHILSDLEKLCDYIAFIDDGEIILNDSKDNLEESLGIISVSIDEIESIPSEAIVSKKITTDIVTLLVKKDLINDGFNIKRPTLEEITLLLLGDDHE